MTTTTTTGSQEPSQDPSTTNIPSAVKKIFLIRHAESEENNRFTSLRRCMHQVSKLKLPTMEDVSTSMELLNVEVDSNVSKVGEKQISHMGEVLKDSNFIQENGIQLVVHSSLLRARETSEGMLGCVVTKSSPDEGDTPNSDTEKTRSQQKKAPGVSRVEESELLVERSPSEWLPTNHRTFLARIAHFEEWLGQQPESVIAVVGHSQYFRTMLNLPFKFGNCEVWEVEYDPTKNDTTIVTDCMKETPVGTSMKGHHKKWSTTVATTGPFYSADAAAAAVKDISALDLPPQWSGLRKLYGCEIARED